MTHPNVTAENDAFVLVDCQALHLLLYRSFLRLTIHTICDYICEEENSVAYYVHTFRFGPPSSTQSQWRRKMSPSRRQSKTIFSYLDAHFRDTASATFRYYDIKTILRRPFIHIGGRFWMSYVQCTTWGSTHDSTGQEKSICASFLPVGR